MIQSEIDLRIKTALVKMHVYEREHNKVSFTHTKEMLQMIFELAPIEEKDLKSMLRISSGIDKRYISQYLDGFRLWHVLYREDGMIYADKPMITEQTHYTVNAGNEVIKTKVKQCPKNMLRAMNEECTIDKCKGCDGL